MFDEKQVFFLEDYPTKTDKAKLMERIRLTVADNKKDGFNSLLLIDDCVTEMLNCELNIQPLMTNG